eukprot:649213-Pelagomonas_calceolata.AAC.4
MACPPKMLDARVNKMASAVFPPTAAVMLIPEDRVVGIQQKTAAPSAMGREWSGSGSLSNT